MPGMEVYLGTQKHITCNMGKLFVCKSKPGSLSMNSCYRATTYNTHAYYSLGPLHPNTDIQLCYYNNNLQCSPAIENVTHTFDTALKRLAAQQHITGGQKL